VIFAISEAERNAAAANLGARFAIITNVDVTAAEAERLEIAINQSPFRREQFLFGLLKLEAKLFFILAKIKPDGFAQIN